MTRVRRPIGAKIFGITVLLLLLMAAVTYTSTRNLGQLSRQLDVLSAQDIPLDQMVGDVRAQYLSQVLWFERLLAQQPRTLDASPAQLAEPFAAKLGDCEAERQREISAEMRKLYEKGARRSAAQYEITRLCGDAIVARAQKTVAEALAMPQVRADPQQVEKFVKLQERLGQIATARGDLQRTVARYLSEVQGGGDALSLEFLYEQLEQNRRTVGRESRELTRLLHDYTQQAAQRAHQAERQAFIFNWTVTLIAVALGLVSAGLLTRNLVQPLRDLLSGAKAIEGGDFNINVAVNSRDEMALLAQSFNYMASGLRERESIKDTFGKYVDPRVVSALLQQQAAPQQGEKRFVSVFFADIQGFTSICEQLTPDHVVRLLNHYFSEMSAPIREHGGIIDKYIGDAIMALWCPPFVDPARHAALACQAALDQFARLQRFRESLPEVTGLRRGLPAFDMRIGIATGRAIVGSIGSDTSRSYTVIGDTANLAARLEAVNKQYGTRIAVSEDTFEGVRGEYELRELDRIRVAGKSEPARVFELLARKGEAPVAQLELRDAYEAALQAYRAQEWASAQAQFEACLQRDAGDRPSQLMLARVRRFIAEPPAADWDGVWNFSEK